MPDVPSPEESPDMGEMFRKRSPDNADEWLRWAALELRWVGDSRPGGNIPADERPSQSRLWIKVSGTLSDDPLIHQAAFTYASDMTLLGSTLVPHGMHVSHPKMQSASLDHTIWFHRAARDDGCSTTRRRRRPALEAGHRPGVQRRRRAGRHGGPGGPDPAPRLTPAAVARPCSAADRGPDGCAATACGAR